MLLKRDFFCFGFCKLSKFWLKQFKNLLRIRVHVRLIRATLLQNYMIVLATMIVIVFSFMLFHYS